MIEFSIDIHIETAVILVNLFIIYNDFSKQRWFTPF